MHKENFKKAVALILSASIATGMSISVFAADNSNDKYVTREYAVSEFVQSIGRNNLKGNENVLKSFDDSDDIDDEYKADFARAASNGVVYGYDDSTLKPKEHISRVRLLQFWQDVWKMQKTLNLFVTQSSLQMYLNGQRNILMF